jgi:predicted nuclease of restriction endonuclease-like (RecB) superfamily
MDQELHIIQSDAGPVADIRRMIEQTREGVARIVNTGMTLLYWRIGKRVLTEVLGNQRADYGDEIVATLSRQLQNEYGRGFSEKNLRRMVQFAEVFPAGEIVATLSRQLGWSHFKEIIYLKNDLQREFYAEMCRVERWSVRTLREKISSMLFERTAISKKPEEVAKAELANLRAEDKLTPDLVFRDPYVLDFLGLKDRYMEKDLEDAILRELEKFLLELGTGFTFQARQFRISIDSDDYHLDLLFYHRALRRLVAIELKLGDFKPEHKGQMELYLRWLAKHEQQPGEEPPLGLILCAGKKKEQIELLELGQSGIHVAEYLTALPSRELLRQKLHTAIETSRARLDNHQGGEA